MANAFEGETAHSAEHFGDARDFWYNADFLQLLQRRWRLGEARSVLELGSGAGHFSRVLLALAAPDATLVGVDREPRWVEVATAKAQAAGWLNRARYQQGSADQLPFEDASFDLVTCQTLLIHCPDPAAVVAEMVRVTRPGGRVLICEPNNLHGPLVVPASLTAPMEELLAQIDLQARCERGKRALGEGDNSLGEAVPALMHEAGLQQIQVFHNDRTFALVPPYDQPGQREVVEELISAFEREVWMWDRACTERYFVAGGGDPAMFPERWALVGRQFAAQVEALRAGRYVQPGGSVMYVASGIRA